jgi:hypothetical protein
VPLIFWPWLIVSTIILLRRRRERRAAAADRTGADQTPTPSPAIDDLLTPPPAPATRVPAAEPLVPPAPFDAPQPTVDSVAAFTPPPPAPSPPEPRTIFDAPSEPEPPSERRPIADMVRGIELPCDLTPLVGAERRSGAREAVAFVTRSFDAATVGQEVGAELRRLGFELSPRHATEVIATRDDDWLGAAVHRDGSAVTRGDRPAFPGAGVGSVVLELWTE